MADINNAVLQFKALGVDRVVFLTAAGGTALFFMAQAESQQYHPHYGLASPDAPSVLAQNAPSDQLAGTMAVGWIPSVDIADAQGPPLSPLERRCLAVNAKYASSFSGRNAATTALAYCDLLWLFERAARAAGPALTTAAWVSGLATLQTSEPSAYTLQAGFGPTRRDGAREYRPLAYDGSCSCFRYTGPARALD